MSPLPNIIWRTLYTLQDEEKDLEDPQLLARIEYIQYTPLWTGDANGYTFNIIDRELTPVQPNPQQLIGRARYLMRIAQIGENAANHREADKTVSKVFGSTSRASILQVKTQYHPQDPQQVKPHYINLNQAEETWQCVSRSRVSPRRVYEAWAELGYKKLRNLLGIQYRLTPDTSNRAVGKRAKIRPCLENTLDPSHDPEPVLLMTIPRVYMVLSSTRDATELALRQPIRPGYYKLILEVRLRGRVGDPRLAALGLTSLILTPQLLGLGKAVNRGLGRFKLTSYTLGPAADKLGAHRDTVERILKALQQGLRGRECLREVLRSYLSLLPQHNRERPRDEDLMAPSLPRATIMHTYRPLHPCPYALAELPQADEDGYCRGHGYDCSRIQDEKIRTYCILSAIGAATLKSIWKLRRGDKLKVPGPGYHTWILGLPRGIIDHNNEKITGYHVTRSGKHWELPDEAPLQDNQILSNIFFDFIKDFIEENIRHQSTFILLPTSDYSLYLINTPSYGSMSNILYNKNGNKALYHAGIHKDNITYEDILAHWSKISSIVTKQHSTLQLKIYKYIYKYNDLFGILTPSSQIILDSNDSIVYNVYDAALDWLRVLLGLNRQYRVSD